MVWLACAAHAKAETMLQPYWESLTSLSSEQYASGSQHKLTTVRERKCSVHVVLCIAARISRHMAPSAEVGTQPT